MNRTAIVLAIGLFAGTAAHLGWHAYRGNPSPDDLDEQLQWMRARLQLNSEQYQRIRAVHEQLAPHLAELSGEIHRLKEQLADFEQQRVRTEEIDFLQFAQFLRHQRSVDQEAHKSTRELIAQSIAAMTPEQRTQYLAMLPPALEQSETHRFH